MSPVASAVFVQKVFKEDKLKKIGDGKKKLEDYEIPGFDMLQFVRDAKEIGEDVFAMHRMFVEKVLGMEGGEVAVVVNGKVVGPPKEGETIEVDDLDLFKKLTMSRSVFVTLFESDKKYIYRTVYVYGPNSAERGKMA